MKKRNIMTASLAFAVMLGSLSLAYFTDRTEGTVVNKAGNVCMALDIDADTELLVPGNTNEVRVTYKNEGTLDTINRVTAVLVHENIRPDEEHKFEGIEDILELSIGDKKSMLDFNGRALVVTDDIENKVGEELTEVIKLRMPLETPNEIQNMDFTVKIIVEAKQDRNDPEWEEVAVSTINVIGGDLDVVEASCGVGIENDNGEFPEPEPEPSDPDEDAGMAEPEETLDTIEFWSLSSQKKDELLPLIESGEKFLIEISDDRIVYSGHHVIDKSGEVNTIELPKAYLGVGYTFKVTSTSSDSNYSESWEIVEGDDSVGLAAIRN